MERLGGWMAVLAAATILAACTESGGTAPRPDLPDIPASDAALDLPTDRAPDSPSDLAPDRLLDAPEDVLPDSAPDSPSDLAPDRPLDAPADVVPDSVPDEAADLPVDLPADPAPDLQSDAPPDALPDGSQDDSQDVQGDPGPSFTPWAAFDDPPPLDGPFFEGVPLLTDLLPFRYHWRTGTERPTTGYLGDFAVGNGRVFALMGLAFPLNTLHGMMGPTYARRDRFYGDVALRLGDASGKAREFDEEWIAAARRAPVVLTVGRSGDLQLATVDLAPYSDDDGQPDPMQSTLWRFLRIRNTGSVASSPGTIVLSANLSQEPLGDAIIERRQDGLRVAWFTTTGAIATDSGLTLPVPAIPAGEEWRTDLVLATAAPDAEPAAVRTAITPKDPVPWLAGTAEAYAAWESSTTQITTPDPIVNDSFLNLRRMLWVQVSAQGASSPLSRYAMAWTRDLSGVVRPLLALGAIPLAERVMDYYYAVAAKAGWLTDAYEADEDVDLANPPAVDWESLPPLAKKAQAEGPSYLPMMYQWLDLTAGDTGRVQARISHLRHAIFGQAISPGFLLPFSGDETYRAAMNMALGLDIEYPHHLKSWSLSSGMLLVTGARALADLEDRLGNAAEAEAARTLAGNVEAATRATYGMEDECLASFVTMADNKVWPPNEDAILTGTWGGPPWDRGTDIDQALDCLVRRVHDGPGAFQSLKDPLYEDFFGLPIEKGVCTGMMPGYTLRAMADAGHPEAEAAFHNLRRSMSPSGNYPEYSVADDHSALEFIYDPSGILGDYTARYRPWEGGINLEAAYHYLVGAEPDAPQARIALRPHLPTGWPSLAASPVIVGPTRISVEVRRDGTALVVDVRHLLGPAITVALTHDAYDGVVPAFALGGTEIPAGDLRVESHFQTQVVTAPGCALAAEGSCLWTIAPPLSPAR